jgi:hypothetical protein
MSEADARQIGELVGEMRGVCVELKRLADAVGEQGSRLARMELNGCAMGAQHVRRLDAVEEALKATGIPIFRALLSGGGGGMMATILFVIVLAMARWMGVTLPGVSN